VTLFFGITIVPFPNSIDQSLEPIHPQTDDYGCSRRADWRGVAGAYDYSEDDKLPNLSGQDSLALLKASKPEPFDNHKTILADQ
jgi:hypothetical protein